MVPALKDPATWAGKTDKCKKQPGKKNPAGLGWE